MKNRNFKHRLFGAVTTAFFASMVAMGLGGNAMEVKATEATATPTPYPTQNYIVSMNNYESDDRDYVQKEEGDNSLSTVIEFGKAVDSDVYLQTYARTGDYFGTGLIGTTNIAQTSAQNGKIWVKYPLEIINNWNSAKIVSYPHKLNADTIGSHLLYIDENGNPAEKDVSKNLNESDISSKDDIHIGIPIKYIYPEGKIGKIDGRDVVISKKEVSNLFNAATTYSGTLYTITKTGGEIVDSFIADLSITSFDKNIEDVWTTPKTVTDSDGNVYPVIGIGTGKATNSIGLPTRIKKVIISENIKFINSDTFYYTQMTEVEFEKPENIAYIGTLAFRCSNLEKIDLTGLLRSEDGCSVLDRGVFLGCKNLKEVTISTTDLEQVYIPSQTFSGCIALENVIWGKVENIQIGNKAFYNSNIKELKFDANTNVQIGKYAFCECTALSTVNIEGDCEIQEGAFYKAISSDSISEGSAYFGASVELEGSAFKLCSKLTNVTFASAKQSGYSAVATITPIATPIPSQGVTPTVNVTPTESLSPTPTPIVEIIPYGETVESYKEKATSAWYDWYTNVYSKNPDIYAIITATPTPGPTSTPTSTPLPEVKKGDTVTLYKACFQGSGITSLEINADHINLHMECLAGIGLNSLKLGGTVLNTYGNLLNQTDNLTDIEISSTQVLFLNDIDDTCYTHYGPSYDGEHTDVPRYMHYQSEVDCSINMGAFTMSKGYVNLIFTKDVEIVGGDYRGTYVHADNKVADTTDYSGIAEDSSEPIQYVKGSEPTQYKDKISNIYFLNPTVRFITGAGELADTVYCGLNSYFHVHPEEGTSVNVYVYDYNNKSYNNNIGSTSLYYPTSKGDSITLGGQDTTYNSYMARKGLENYISSCTFSDKTYKKSETETVNYIQYCDIQEGSNTLTAQYGTDNQVVVGTKFDPSKLIVKQTYNTSLTDAEKYTITLNCEGPTTTGTNAITTGSEGFRYSINAGVLDSEGNFILPDTNEKKINIAVYHGSQTANVAITVLEKDATSYEVTLPTLIVGKTVTLDDFKITNLIFNDGEEISSTTLKALEDKGISVNVKFMDGTGAVLETLGSNAAKSFEITKAVDTITVTIINKRDTKTDLSQKVLDVAPESLTVSLTEEGKGKTFYENDKTADLKKYFSVVVNNNNGTTNEGTLSSDNFTITGEKLVAGENELEFTYTDKNGVSATGTCKVNATAEKVVAFSSVNPVSLDKIYVVEGSNLDLDGLEIIMSLNSGRTKTLTSEEKRAHCSVPNDVSAIKVGVPSSITLTYDDITTTITVTGAKKEIVALKAALKENTSSETPAKVWYVGDTITADDLIVVGYYNNNTETESDYKGYTIENPTLTAETNEIVIYRTDKKDVCTTITVNAKVPILEKITVEYNGPKELPEGSSIDKNNLVVKAVYNNGEVVLNAEDYTLEYEIINNKECKVLVWYNKKNAEFMVDGVAAPTATPTPTATPAPTKEPTATATPVPTTTTTSSTPNTTATPTPTNKVTNTPAPTKAATGKFTYTIKSGSKKLKLNSTSKKVTYKTYLKKKITLKANSTNGKVYYQVVKSGKKVSSKGWKKVTKTITIKSNMKAVIYVKYTLNGKTVTKKTNGFVLDTKAPTVKISKTGKITVKDNLSGVKSIKDGKKKIKNKSTLKKGVHKITVTDKAGNKKTVKVTIK